jgi:hypothetical protein
VAKWIAKGSARIYETTLYYKFTSNCFTDVNMLLSGIVRLKPRFGSGNCKVDAPNHLTRYFATRPNVKPSSGKATGWNSLTSRAKSGIILMGFGCYSFAVYTTYRWMIPISNDISKIDDKTPTSPVEQPDRRHIFNADLASRYDDEIHWDEWMMGLLLLRRCMIRKATVHIIQRSFQFGRS